jgi:hypothetical protein
MLDCFNENENRSIHDPINTLGLDRLGRQDLAQRVLDRLCETDAGVLGIYGGWGTGKSSLLKLLCLLNEEKGKPDIYIQMIDAWKYEMTGSLFVPIISALVKFAKKEVLSAETNRKYLKRMGKMALLGASDIVLRQLGLSVEDVKKLAQDARDESAEGISYLDWEKIVDEVESTQRAFCELIQVSLNGLEKEEGYKLKRIVFCIDNLDRCAPENAINLLESVKNFLIVPGCTWVFAVDSEVIASYINKKYEDTAVNGYDYLDKIISEQYHLSLSPAVDGRNIVDILRYAAGNNFLDFDEEKIPQIPKVLVPRRLIKSAGKVSDFYKTSYAGSASFETIFHLTLLYHTWPDFYQRLSSTSRDHVCGILDNFFPTEEDLQEAKPVSQKTIRDAINLGKKYADDHDLSQFLKTAFKDYGNMKNAFVDELINGLMGLRLTGLP